MSRGPMRHLRRPPREGRTVARALYTGPFIDDLVGLPEYAFGAVRARCEVAAEFPGIGSSLLEPSLVRVYGASCLKLVACGYDILYERLDDRDSVVFLGIVPQRRAR